MLSNPHATPTTTFPPIIIHPNIKPTATPFWFALLVYCVRKSGCGTCSILEAFSRLWVRRMCWFVFLGSLIYSPQISNKRLIFFQEQSKYDSCAALLKHTFQHFFDFTILIEFTTPEIGLVAAVVNHRLKVFCLSECHYRLWGSLEVGFDCQLITTIPSLPHLPNFWSVNSFPLT